MSDSEFFLFSVEKCRSSSKSADGSLSFLLSFFFLLPERKKVKANNHKKDITFAQTKEENMYQEAIEKYLKQHGHEKINLKAVLFDMDGVLFNSMPNHASSWHKVMERMGFGLS